jgi:hypothetical protein
VSTEWETIVPVAEEGGADKASDREFLPFQKDAEALSTARLMQAPHGRLSRIDLLPGMVSYRYAVGGLDGA